VFIIPVSITRRQENEVFPFIDEDVSGFFSESPASDYDRTQGNTVVMETSKGIIEIELDRVKAPITVDNFINYVTEGFYDGLCFHRIISGFMIQGGGFNSNSTFKQPGNPIKIESNNGLKNLKGTIAMARSSDPNSATSQFFINTVDNPNLDYPSFDGYGYTVFGKVSIGLNVIESIEGTQTETKQTPYGPMDDWPIEDVKIIKAYMKSN
jgi:cyclophilin family peptidyl-prolyl cis-trans isomerase